MIIVKEDDMLLGCYTLRSAKVSDATRCFTIEETAYEGDEAATQEKITKRIKTYPDGFLVIEINKEIAGFINCGCADKVEMSDEAFKELVGHDPNGKHCVIMSVVVHPDYQKQGIAVVLMENFILRMRRLQKESIQLMCRTHHIGFYEQFGFRYIKPSESLHGGLQWHEMKLNLYKA